MVGYEAGWLEGKTASDQKSCRRIRRRQIHVGSSSQTLVEHQPRKHVRIDVAAADDHTDALALDRKRYIQDSGSSEATGWFDDHLHTFGEKSHGSDERCVGYREHVSDEPP